MTRAASPHTPGLAQMYNDQINSILAKLSSDWDLDLPLSEEKTSMISAESELSRKQSNCLAKVKLLVFKDKIAPVYLQFETDALALYNGWINKPNGL